MWSCHKVINVELPQSNPPEIYEEINNSVSTKHEKNSNL
jgi:hypothetical protein